VADDACVATLGVYLNYEDVSSSFSVESKQFSIVELCSLRLIKFNVWKVPVIKRYPNSLPSVESKCRTAFKMPTPLDKALNSKVNLPAVNNKRIKLTSTLECTFRY
jgi:hypothetical protein